MALEIVRERIGGIWKTVAKPAPGGGSQPIRALYSGFTGVSIDNNQNANLPIDSLDDGAALLDISTPAQPVFLTPGTYIVCTDQVSADAKATAGGHYSLGLVGLDASAATLVSAQGAAAIGPVADFPPITICVVAAAPGVYLNIVAANFDGVSARNFSVFELSVVKIA